MKRTLLPLFALLLAFLAALPAASQSVESIDDAVRQYFSSYHLAGYTPADPMRMDSCRVDDEHGIVFVYANEPFCSQPFTPSSVTSICRDIARRLPQPYNTYRVEVRNKKGVSIEELIPNMLRGTDGDRSRLWGDIDFTGNAWVTNLSRPYTIPRGLTHRHLMINASHGRYYRVGGWRWQRPYTFCTTEDLFTQSIVFPYLIPMLENAGAVVATGRERDTQTAEALIDNDNPTRQGTYAETSQDDATWRTVTDSCGFAMPTALLVDSIQPFTCGTAREVPAVSRRSRLATATWTPRIPRAGQYAVYVSYSTRPNSVSDARYTVYHKGGATRFRVNQQMGGSTWVYLGTFEFDEGENRDGRVTLSNQSDSRGVVTADAVRFGGGVGQTERGNAGTSGLPRHLEGARYYAQWAGLPDSLYNRDGGTNDYNDDIRSRSYLTNFLGGGSAYIPASTGRGVPFELSLAVHSDAGVRHDNSIFGTLAICTTVDGDGHTNYPAGISRQASNDFAAALQDNIVADLSRTYNVSWTRRELWDRNYGETRSPNVPSAIIEILSHQNFADMRYGHDPHFKFTLARAIYKAILAFVNYEHGVKNYAIQPLPPHAFAAELTQEGVRLSWQATEDTLTDGGAKPTAYVVYMRTDDDDFDNGTLVRSTNYTLPLTASHRYSFRVTAVNDGGESFPTETLCVRRSESPRARVLIVNGFTRLGGPAQVMTADSLGFDLDADLGVPYLYTTAWAGRQRNFDASAAGLEGSSALGFSGSELMGQKIAGNTFDYPCLHGAALAAAGDYAFTSCSREAFISGAVNPKDYDVVDYICGLERRAEQDLVPGKTFDAATRDLLTDYLKQGGNLLVSGSYIASDMLSTDEREFTHDILKYDAAGTARTDSTGTVRGLSLEFAIRRQPSSDGYCLQSPDVLAPADKSAFTTFAYGGGQSAGIAYAGKKYRVIAMGFPFETITDADVRRQAIRALVDFLVQR